MTQSDWRTDWPTLDDVGRLVEVEIDGALVRGEIAADALRIGDDEALAVCISADDDRDFFSAERWRFLDTTD